MPAVPLSALSPSSVPPLPTIEGELDRARHTRLRRRLLYGQWRDDLIERIERAIGSVRREAWGEPDLSANPFRAICSQVSVTYDRAPQVSHPDGAAEAFMRELLEQSGWSQLMARVQRDTIGLREMLMRVDVQDGEVLLRPVFPDMVSATPDTDRPDLPVAVRELRLRTIDQRLVWAYDVLDVSDPAAPSYRIEVADAGRAPRDVSDQVLGAGALNGQQYPYRDSAGKPVLPYVMWHAHRTGMLWDPWEGSEVVEGTLNVAVVWSMWAHAVRSASWPQRYAVDVEIPSSEVVGTNTNARHEVIADPATILILARAGDSAGQPIISQFQPGADPAMLAESIGQYERRLAAYAGISASDIQRVSGDPRSGYALAISREGQREAARRIEPQFMRGDLQLMRVIACLWNRWAEANNDTRRLPEGGWSIRYESVPPSSDELSQTRDQLTWEADRKLIGPVEMWRRLHPGASAEQAEAALVAAAVEEARVTKLSQQAIEAQGLGEQKRAEPVSAAALQAVQQVAISVSAGQMTTDGARAVLTTLVGLSEEQAAAIIPDTEEDMTDERPDPEPDANREPDAGDDSEPEPATGEQPEPGTEQPA